MSSILQKLIEGNEKFRKKFLSDDYSCNAMSACKGQEPHVMVIACSDSRVDPAILFDCQLGQLFVVRNVANLVPPCEEDNAQHGISAALEYGVCFLPIEHIIVLGHTGCGGIRALIENNGTPILTGNSHSFIAKWMQLAQPACQATIQQEGQSTKEISSLCEREALLNSVRNLSSFPWIRTRVDAGTLSLHAWLFDVSTGLIDQVS